MHRLSAVGSRLRASDYVCLSCRHALSLARSHHQPFPPSQKPALLRPLFFSQTRALSSAAPSLSAAATSGAKKKKKQKNKKKRKTSKAKSATRASAGTAAPADNRPPRAHNDAVDPSVSDKSLQGPSSSTSSTTKTRRRRSLFRMVASREKERAPESPTLDIKDQSTEAARQRVDQPGVSMSSIGRSLQHAISKRAFEATDMQVQSGHGLSSLGVVYVPQPPVPRLAHGLDRALFNPGVLQFRDTRSGVYNFDPELEKLMPIHEFDFNSLVLFTPPSRDQVLARIARESRRKYIASTSSMTGMLKQFHLLLSAFRPLNFAALSREMKRVDEKMTKMTMAPDVIFLRWKDGVYAVDADKEFDGANVLSLMGRYMEKLLTLDSAGFKRHRINAENPITEQEKREPEAYNYSTCGDFLLRSQLDAYDERLPGSGMFDLKTRAVAPIRMDSADFYWGMDYEIWQLRGQWQSFEREYHDMVRSTMLKYSLQARMGRMDGIFVAFHNIARMFGFQYISIDEMDTYLHGQSDRTLGNLEFLHSLKLINQVFDRATAAFPKQSIRFHFEAREGRTNFMYIFAEPFSEEEVEQIQSKNKQRIAEWERKILAGESVAETSRIDDTSSVGQAALEADQEITPSLLDRYHPEDLENNEVADGATIEPEQPTMNEQPSEPIMGELDPVLSMVVEDCLPEDEKNPPPKSRWKTDRERMQESLQTERASGKEILGYILETRSTVNGESVERPVNIKESDSWDLQYKLLPIQDNEKAWALYAACKQRRWMEYNKDDEPAQQENNFFMRELREMSRRSKRQREDFDKREADSGKTTRMWNDMPPKSPPQAAASANAANDATTTPPPAAADLTPSATGSDESTAVNRLSQIDSDTLNDLLSQVRGQLAAYYSANPAFASAVGTDWLRARVDPSSNSAFTAWAQTFIRTQRLLSSVPAAELARQCAFLTVSLARAQAGMHGDLDLSQFAHGREPAQQQPRAGSAA